MKYSLEEVRSWQPCYPDQKLSELFASPLTAKEVANLNIPIEDKLWFLFNVFTPLDKKAFYSKLFYYSGEYYLQTAVGCWSHSTDIYEVYQALLADNNTKADWYLAAARLLKEQNPSYHIALKLSKRYDVDLQIILDHMFYSA